MNNKNIDKQIGILDPNGVNLNPLNGQQYSEEYKQISKAWSVLPAYKNAQKLIKQINDN